MLNGISILLITVCDIYIEISKHFADLRYTMNIPFLQFIVFTYHCVYFVYVGYLNHLLSKQNPPDFFSYLPFSYIIVFTIIVTIFVNLLELMQKIEPTLYKDLSILNSCYTIATCFFSFFQLLVRDNPKDRMIIVDTGEKT